MRSPSKSYSCHITIQTCFIAKKKTDALFIRCPSSFLIIPDTLGAAASYIFICLLVLFRRLQFICDKENGPQGTRFPSFSLFLVIAVVCVACILAGILGAGVLGAVRRILAGIVCIACIVRIAAVVCIVCHNRFLLIILICFTLLLWQLCVKIFFQFLPIATP